MGKKILEKIISGISDKNIRFNELRNTLIRLGFDERVKGSHHTLYQERSSGDHKHSTSERWKDETLSSKAGKKYNLKYKLHKEVRDV